VRSAAFARRRAFSAAERSDESFKPAVSKTSGYQVAGVRLVSGEPGAASARLGEFLAATCYGRMAPVWRRRLEVPEIWRPSTGC